METGGGLACGNGSVLPDAAAGWRGCRREGSSCATCLMLKCIWQ